MDFKAGVWRFFHRSGSYVLASTGNKIDYARLFPNIDLFVWRPVISEPQLCTYKELCDGTYNLNDLMNMHEALNLLTKVKEDANS